MDEDGHGQRGGEGSVARPAQDHEPPGLHDTRRPCGKECGQGAADQRCQQQLVAVERIDGVDEDGGQEQVVNDQEVDDLVLERRDHQQPQQQHQQAHEPVFRRGLGRAGRRCRFRSSRGVSGRHAQHLKAVRASLQKPANG